MLVEPARLRPNSAEDLRVCKTHRPRGKQVYLREYSPYEDETTHTWRCNVHLLIYQFPSYIDVCRRSYERVGVVSGSKKRDGAKTKTYGTSDSHVVPHHSTNEALSSLTLQIGRDAVIFAWYGRRWKGRNAMGTWRSIRANTPTLNRYISVTGTTIA